MAEWASLSEILLTSAERFGEAQAVRCAGLSDGVSFVDLAARMMGGAAHLAAHGIEPGDRVVLALRPGPEWVSAFFAIAHAGAVVVPLPLSTPVASIAAIHRHTAATAAIYEGQLGLLDVRQVALPAGNGPAMVGKASREDLAVLGITSGSTSRPRAVELTHANILADIEALLQVRAEGPGDRLLSMLPPAHLFELVGGLLAPLACGAEVVFAGVPMPNRLVAALRQEEISHALAVPALLQCLYDEVVDRLIVNGVILPERRFQSPAETAMRMRTEVTPEDLAAIKAGVRDQIGSAFSTLIVGGAAADPAIASILADVGIRLELGYGLTEAAPIVSVGYASQVPAGSVGQALPGIEVRIADDQEILVRGANVMRGYFRDAAATAEALTPDGWLHTGDCGRIDADGFLFINGRLKEVIVTAAGETIYPDEAEPYYGSPLFAEHCVAGVRDANGNDLLTLFVVAKPGIAAAELERAYQALRQTAPTRLRTQLLIQLTDPLPRTPTGKVRRHALQTILHQGG
jgi:long-chain acyl-CoA synthetase